MDKKPKQNRWTDEDKWTAFLAPLEAHLKAFKIKDEDDEEFVQMIRMQINRGNRDADKRPKIVKNLKIEFEDEQFAEWQQIRLADSLVRLMKKEAKANRPAHKAFFLNSKTVQTYTKDSVKYAFRDWVQFCDSKEKSDLTHFKGLHKQGLDWKNPIYAVEVENDEEE
jgi:hypothetical protein